MSHLQLVQTALSTETGEKSWKEHGGLAADRPCFVEMWTVVRLKLWKNGSLVSNSMLIKDSNCVNVSLAAVNRQSCFASRSKFVLQKQKQKQKQTQTITAGLSITWRSINGCRSLLHH